MMQKEQTILTKIFKIYFQLLLRAIEKQEIGTAKFS
jgi:hypothetical protein